VATVTLDLWRVRLDELDAHPRLSGCLDAAEVARASRFLFPRDSTRFVASRVALRHILAHYLDARPHAVRLGNAAAGKPYLPDRPDLHFNLSHADDLLLVGVSHGRRLGVDVERIPGDSVVDETSGLVLSAPERAMIARLRDEARREWFARLWTRKEAYIKADGRGMGLKLELIDVMTAPDRVRLCEEGPGRWAASPHWSLRTIPADAGYAAAVAVEGDDCGLESIDWPGALSLVG
jgi:4'-phosphopantetheinyl transferase